MPYWHEPLYRAKVWAHGDWWRHINLPILCYGHCNFEPEEVLFTFTLLRLQVEGFTLFNADNALTADQYHDYVKTDVAPRERRLTCDMPLRRSKVVHAVTFAEGWGGVARRLPVWYTQLCI